MRLWLAYPLLFFFLILGFLRTGLVLVFDSMLTFRRMFVNCFKWFSIFKLISRIYWFRVNRYIFEMVGKIWKPLMIYFGQYLKFLFGLV